MASRADIRKLEEEMYNDKSRLVNADLHNHWRTSSWVRNRDLERACIQANRTLGSGAVIGLVNFEDSRYEETIDKASRTSCFIADSNAGNGVYVPKYGVLVVKGQEVPTAQGHVLFLGLDRDTFIQRGVPVEERSLVDTLKQGRAAGAIAIIDHPFYKDGIFANNPRPLCTVEMKELVDAYEIHNGEAALGLPFIAPSHANDIAFNKFYDKGGIRDAFPHLVQTVSSDGHSFREIGSSHMEIPMPLHYFFENSEELRNAVDYGICHNTQRCLDNYKRESKFGALKHIAELGVIMANSKLAGKLPSRLATPFRYLDGKFRRADYNVPQDNSPISDFC